MGYNTEDINYDSFVKQSTGSHENTVEIKVITCPFEKYEIKIKLS